MSELKIRYNCKENDNHILLVIREGDDEGELWIGDASEANHLVIGMEDIKAAMDKFGKLPNWTPEFSIADNNKREVELKDVHVGDTVKIKNRSDNAVHKVGIYEMQVIAEDKRGIAVQSFGKWWFYRDTGESYAGDAVIEVVRKLEGDDATTNLR